MYSGTESALFALSPEDLEIYKEKYPKKYRKILFFSKNNNSTIAAILLGNLFVNIAASSIFTQVSLILFESNAIEYSMVILTFIIVIFGEITPKTFAIKNKFKMLNFSQNIIYMSYYIFYPFHKFMNFLINIFLPESNDVDNVSYSIDDIKKAMEISYSSGSVSLWEKSIITHLAELENLKVAELMVPRVKIIGIDINDEDISKVWDIFKKHKIKKIPVYKDDMENLVGILYLKDIIGISEEELRNNYKTYLRKPLYITEYKKVSILLQEFRTTKKYFAMVVDEYGSISGIITLSTILHFFTKDIVPEKINDIEFLDKNNVVVPADISLENFNQIFYTNLQDDYYESIAGFIIRHLGKIPKSGEIFKYNNLVFTILEADPNKIKKIKVKRITSNVN